MLYINFILCCIYTYVTATVKCRFGSNFGIDWNLLLRQLRDSAHQQYLMVFHIYCHYLRKMLRNYECKCRRVRTDLVEQVWNTNYAAGKRNSFLSRWNLYKGFFFLSEYDIWCFFDVREVLMFIYRYIFQDMSWSDGPYSHPQQVDIFGLITLHLMIF